MNLDWKWLGWQVGVPLVAPSSIAAWAALSAAASRTAAAAGADAGAPWAVILDHSPWALLTYGLAILATTARDWPKLTIGRPRSAFWWAAGLIGLAELLFFHDLAQARFDTDYRPSTLAYALAAILTAASVVTGYLCRVRA